MKTKITYLTLLVAGLLTACSSSENKQEQDHDSAGVENTDTLLVEQKDATSLDTVDVSFFKNAAYGGMVEVESSNKILQSTGNGPVKSFATMMTKDHGDANAKLKTLANSKGYLLPKALPNSKIEKINMMNELKEEGRNEYYVQLMIAEHRQAIDLFSLASKSKDSDIAGFATAVLPTLNHHYQEIMKIDTLIKMPKVNQGDDPLKISNRDKKKIQ